MDVRRARPDRFTEAVDPGDPASPTFGGIAEGSLARQDEILDILEERFSRYPFSTGGGIVDDYDNLQFAWPWPTGAWSSATPAPCSCSTPPCTTGGR